MSIKSIRIQNFKSIKDIKIDITDNEVISLIGRNGVGKTSIFDAIRYFFENLQNSYSQESVIDKLNKYTQRTQIEISFDFTSILIKNDEYAKKILEKKGYNKDNNHCIITLKQNKQGEIAWDNIDNELRGFIKKYYPLFQINTRNLDIYSWNLFYEVIKTFLAVDSNTLQNNEKNFKENLYKFISDNYSDKVKTKIEKIENLFYVNGIKMDKYNYENRMIDLIKVFFGGESLLKDEYSFDFYSDGTNSYNYIKIIIQIIAELKERSSKNAIILIDEPEIGLHPFLIKEIVNEFEKITTNAQLCITTHSPELVCQIIKSNLKLNLFKVDLVKKYTKLTKLNTTYLNKNNHVITTNETRLYFSNLILMLEGESEMQLYTHKVLMYLYPELSRVSFYNTKSNDQMKKNVTNQNFDLGIPCLDILDLDKKLAYNKNNFFKSKYCLFDDNEYYRNYKKYARKKEASDNINKLLQHKYMKATGKNYVEDDNYKSLITYFKIYYSFENILLNSNTIESLLITEDNLKIFLNFIIKSNNFFSDSLIEFTKHVAKLNDVKENVFYLRTIFNGKNDLLQSEEVDFIIKASNFNGCKKKKLVKQEKANGWIYNWIEYFNEKELGGLDFTEKKKKFSQNFKELDDILNYIVNML